MVFFFFQAEDGIRDIGVTGVQTCALPISTTSEEEVQLVHDRLDWESAQLAETIACEGTFLQRSLRQALNLFSKNVFGPIELEREQEEAPKRKPEQVVSPF